MTLREEGGGSGGGSVKGGEAMTVKDYEDISNNTSTLSKLQSETRSRSESRHKHTEKRERTGTRRYWGRPGGAGESQEVLGITTT